MVPAVSEIWWEIKKAPQINDLQGYISKAVPLFYERCNYNAIIELLIIRKTLLSLKMEA